MENQKRFYAAIVVIVVAALVFGWLLFRNAQKEPLGPLDAATIKVSPEGASFKAGQSFNVDVVVSSSDQPINAVSGRLSFPADKLEVVAIDDDGSILTIWPELPTYSNSSGIIAFEGVRTSGFIGENGHLFSIRFNAKKESSVELSFISGSVLAHDGFGTNVLTGLQNTQFSIFLSDTQPPPASQDDQSPTAKSLSAIVNGRILLDVETNGEAWYVLPETVERYYLGRPKDAFRVMRELSLGISDDNIRKIRIALPQEQRDEDADGDGLENNLEIGIGTDPFIVDTDADSFDDKTEVLLGYNPLGDGSLSFDSALTKQLLGKIVLQVERNGEAWYIWPENSRRYYLSRPADAFRIMRELGLGISVENLSKVKIAPGSTIPPP